MEDLLWKNLGSLKSIYYIKSFIRSDCLLYFFFMFNYGMSLKKLKPLYCRNTLLEFFFFKGTSFFYYSPIWKLLNNWLPEPNEPEFSMAFPKSNELRRSWKLLLASNKEFLLDSLFLFTNEKDYLFESLLVWLIFYFASF